MQSVSRIQGIKVRRKNEAREDCRRDREKGKRGRVGGGEKEGGGEEREKREEERERQKVKRDRVYMWVSLLLPLAYIRMYGLWSNSGRQRQEILHIQLNTGIAPY